MKRTPEQLAARRAAAQASAIASTRPTTKPGSERTRLRVGDEVEVTRGRMAGRQGAVVWVNRQRFPTGVTYVEIGVSFTTQATRATTWFRDDELRRLVL